MDRIRKLLAEEDPILVKMRRLEIDLKRMEERYKLEREEKEKLKQRVREYEAQVEELKVEGWIHKNFSYLSEGRHKEELRLVKEDAEKKIDAIKAEIDRKIAEMHLWEEDLKIRIKNEERLKSEIFKFLKKEE